MKEKKNVMAELTAHIDNLGALVSRLLNIIDDRNKHIRLLQDRCNSFTNGELCETCDMKLSCRHAINRRRKGGKRNV